MPSPAKALYVKHFLCERPTGGTGSGRNCSGVSSRVWEMWGIPFSYCALLAVVVFFKVLEMPGLVFMR